MLPPSILSQTLITTTTLILIKLSKETRVGMAIPLFQHHYKEKIENILVLVLEKSSFPTVTNEKGKVICPSFS